uniref:Uncharacterized protein n=1 Tax=Psilocybe cubensis TaxID=181762 RepID=A0A8H8CH31_PSICU
MHNSVDVFSMGESAPWAAIQQHFFSKVSSHPAWLAPSADIFTGLIIASLIVLIFVAVFLLREWMSQNARLGVFEEEELPDLPPVYAPPPQPQLQHQPRLVRHFAPLDPASLNLERGGNAPLSMSNLDTNIAVDPNRWRADAQIAALRDRKKKMNAKSFNPHHTVRDENQGETDQEDVQFELEQARKKKFNQHVTVAQDGDEPGLVSPSESDDTEDDEDDFHEDDEVDNEGHGHGNGRRHRRPHPLRRPHFEEEKDDEDDEEDQAKLCSGVLPPPPTPFCGFSIRLLTLCLTLPFDLKRGEWRGIPTAHLHLHQHRLSTIDLHIGFWFANPVCVLRLHPTPTPTLTLAPQLILPHTDLQYALNILHCYTPHITP